MKDGIHWTEWLLVILAILAVAVGGWAICSAQEPPDPDRDPSPQADALFGDGPAIGRRCVLEDLEPGMRFEELGRRGVEWVVCEPAGLVDRLGTRWDGGYWWPGDGWSDYGWGRSGYLPPWKGHTPEVTNWMVKPQPLAVRVDTGEARLWEGCQEVRRTR